MLAKFIHNNNYLFVININSISDLNILEQIVYNTEDEITYTYKIKSIRLIYDEGCINNPFLNENCESIYYLVLLEYDE